MQITDIAVNRKPPTTEEKIDFIYKRLKNESDMIDIMLGLIQDKHGCSAFNFRPSQELLDRYKSLRNSKALCVVGYIEGVLKD